MSAPADPGRAARSDRWLALGVALCSALLFATLIDNGFVLDDAQRIRDNPSIRSLANVSRFFASDFGEPFARLGLYRPLVTTSYALNHAVGGLDPRGYLAVGLLLHAANAALALLLLVRWTGSRAVGVAAACLFAAHAVHAEVLANVASGRPELLAAFFGLLSLYTAPCPARAAEPRTLRPASLACFALALASKESAITLLAVLPLLDAFYGQGEAATWQGARRLWRRRVRVYAAYAGVAIVYAGIRWLVLPGADVLPAQHAIDNPLLMLPAGWRVVNAIQVGFRYLGLLVFPLHLSYDYSHAQIPLIRSFDDASLYALVALGALLLFGLAAGARRSRDVAFGAAFAVATFSVVSNVVVPIGTILGERLLYLPSLGFSLALAAGLYAVAVRVTRSPRAALHLFGAVMALLVVLHAARAVERGLDWRTENGLYLHDLAVSPRSAKVQSNAGAAWAELGRHEDALRCYAAAIAIAPDFAAPHRGSVLSLLAVGRFAEAEAMYEQTLRFGPRVPEVEEAIRIGREASGQ